MFEVKTTSMQAVKHLMKFATALFLYVFLWQPFPGRLHGDFQLASRLKLRLEFMVFFLLGGSDVVAQQVQIWRVWGHSFFSVNLGQFACVMLGMLENGDVLNETA